MYLRRIIRQTGTYEDVPFTEEKMCLGDGAAEIFPNPKKNSAVIVCYYNTEIYGQPFVGQRQLKHDTLIAINDGDLLYIFKNDKQKVKDDQTRIVKIRHASDIEKKVDKEKILKEVKKLFLTFITAHAEDPLKSFAYYLLKFANEFCKFERVILYRVFIEQIPNIPVKKFKCRWKPVHAINALRKKFKPSKDIVHKAYFRAEPVYVDCADSDNLSQSLLENNVKTVLCYPIFSPPPDQKAIFVFYGESVKKPFDPDDPDESQREQEENEAFLTISYFCQHLSTYLNNFISPVKLKHPSPKELNKLPAEKQSPVPELKKLTLQGDDDDDKSV